MVKTRKYSAQMLWSDFGREADCENSEYFKMNNVSVCVSVKSGLLCLRPVFLQPSRTSTPVPLGVSHRTPVSAIASAYCLTGAQPKRH